MIHRDRSIVDVPESCDGDESAAHSELEQAERYYAEYTPGDKAFKFKVYKNEDINSALEALFGKKCAYCESPYLGGHPTDVEHYRPKAGIKKENQKGYITPGYWWLGASWDNLFPSCIRCNRKEGHEVDGVEIMLGKGNHFPLHPDSNSIRARGSEEHETALLINPCREDPADFLRFVDRFGNIIVEPVSDKELELLKAEASIRYYGLNRPDLVEDRSTNVRRMMLFLIQIEKNMALGRDISEIDDELKLIREEFTDPKNRFSAACSSFFKQWFSGLNP